MGGLLPHRHDLQGTTRSPLQLLSPLCYGLEGEGGCAAQGGTRLHGTGYRTHSAWLRYSPAHPHPSLPQPFPNPSLSTMLARGPPERSSQNVGLRGMRNTTYSRGPAALTTTAGINQGLREILQQLQFRLIVYFLGPANT